MAFDLAKLADAIELVFRESPPDPPARRSRRRPSLFGGLEEWAATHAHLAGAALGALGDDTDASLIGQLLTAWFARFASGDPSQRVRPLVMGPTEPGGVRVAVLDAFTDRDALIEALIGRPVPRMPRYRRDFRPPLALEPGSGEGLDAVYARAAVAPTAFREALARREVVEQVSDLGGQRVLGFIADREPAAFDALPIGAVIGAVASAGPLWATRVSLDVEFAFVFDCGRLGVVGFAWWVPGDPGLRRYRRPLAAHLRYLFDHEIAPWGRWKEPWRRDEALGLILGKGDNVTMREFAASLRGRDPGRYAGEDISTTTRRLFRLSARLKRERRAFASVRRLLRQADQPKVPFTTRGATPLHA